MNCGNLCCSGVPALAIDLRSGVSPGVALACEYCIDMIYVSVEMSGILLARTLVSKNTILCSKAHLSLLMQPPNLSFGSLRKAMNIASGSIC
jgi:hypothetical protein